MKILFLCSGKNSCRSLIAQTIMESLDNELEVSSAGVEPVSDLNPVAFELMDEMGMQMDRTKLKIAEEYSNTLFDFIITVCEGTHEEFHKLPLQFKKKLHLGFVDPEKVDGDKIMQISAYTRFIEEVKTELDYFYNHILKS